MTRTLPLLIILLIALQIQGAEPAFLIDDSNKEISINTADNYSLKTRTEMVEFTTVKATEIAELVKPSLSQYGKILINEALNALIITEEQAKLQNIMTLCMQLDTEELKNYQHIYTEKIEMQYNKASEILPFVTSYLSVDGSIKSDDAFNMLIVSDNRYSIEKITQKVRELDQPQKQIVIDLEIVEIEKNGLKENGFDWDNILAQSWGIMQGQLTSSAASSEILTPIDIYSSGKSYGGNAGLSVADVRSIVRVMQEQGHAKVLSTPRVITISGKQARLWYGKDIKYPNLSFGETSLRDRIDQKSSIDKFAQYLSAQGTLQNLDYYDRYDTPMYSTQEYFNKENTRLDREKASGLDLRITPHAGNSDIIKIDLNCVLTSIIGWSEGGAPIVSGQEIDNNILGYKDQTILIGGLKRVQTEEVTRRIPGLGHILPFLFSRKKKQEVETEIAMFITPRIFDINEMSKKAPEEK